MSLETKSKTIGATEYVVRQLPATKGRLVLLRLAKALGPVAASISATKDKHSAMAESLEKAISSVTDDDFTFLCNTFADSTDVTINDDKGRRSPKLATIFDLHFAGNYLEMVQWLVFCVEVNFGSFFAAAGLAPAIGAPTKSA